MKKTVKKKPKRPKARQRNAKPAVAKQLMSKSDTKVKTKKPEKAVTPIPTSLRLALLVAMLGLMAWAYWPTLVNLEFMWQIEPDYSHGYLVAPLTLFFLWLRRDSLPEFSKQFAFLGLGLIILSGAMRWFSAQYYMETIDGWSIPIWVGGVVWLLFGWKVFRWAAPAIAFLFFMIPLPYVIENMLAGPLQSASTKVSCFVLQCLHLPALNEGNTILLGDHRLEVARACSGLRIFMGIFAMAYALIMIFPRSWFIKCLMLVGALPIALLANSARIVATGLLYEQGFQERWGPLIHDMAGWLMIPVAAIMYLFFLFFIDRLFPINETVDVKQVIRAT